MLTKYSVLMMVLIVAASLVGISSIMYKPTNVETQPLQPQQPPQQGQIQSPNTAPPTLGKRPAAPQGLQQQQSDVGRSAQMLEDRALVDRIFPYIIQKIDGKTLAQKIDVATLLQKVDAKTLAAKVLPYLDITASVSSRQGTPSILNVQNIARDLGLTGAEARGSTAKCIDGEIAVSGGFSFDSDPEDSYVYTNSLSQENGWYTAALMGDNGKIQAFVTCLTINVALKDAQQPSLPPGGAPLQPPNLR